MYQRNLITLPLPYVGRTKAFLITGIVAYEVA